MKYAIILPDGSADEPVRALGGDPSEPTSQTTPRQTARAPRQTARTLRQIARTPLQAAPTPNMDDVARKGTVGNVVTVPAGYLPGSDVATLSLFGYDPARYYRGRAPLEAVAQGLSATPDQVIFRCNFVTIENGVMRDFTAGHISQSDADALIADLNKLVAKKGTTFHAGVSYRNLMIAPRPGDEQNSECAIDDDVSATPPHDFPDQTVIDHLPCGVGADSVRRIMQTAHDMLVDHPINKARAARGERVATDIWLWGQGRITPLPTLSGRFKLSGAAIAAVDIVRGIAKSAGLSIIEVPGATGYLDTDYAAKGWAGVDALDAFDLVAIHVEAPDEAGHLGDADAKVKAIEQVDEHVVGPVLEKLRSIGDYRVLIAPDHPTPVEKRIHTSDPPPFCMSGSGIPKDAASTFDEPAAARSGLVVDPGFTLLERFLES